MNAPPRPEPYPTSPTVPPGVPEGYLERWMQRRQRRFRIIMFLFVFLAVASVAIAWGVWYHFHRHWMAASALRLDGLTVQWELGDGGWKHGGRTHVTNARWQVMPGDVEGEDLNRLADLVHVQTLSLRACLNLTDDDLDVLASLPELRHLDLTMTRPDPSYDRPRLSDATIDKIKGLDNLEELNLVDVDITDSGLKRFPRLPGLRFLDLTGTKITGAGLASLLEQLPALETLGLERTSTSREDVEAVWRARPGLIVLHDSTVGQPLPID